MAETTKIEWADATWNPWMGCLKVSPGCKNCYMYRERSHYGHDPKVVSRSKTTFRDPLKWVGKKPNDTKIFTCSWSDWFIDQADEWRDEAWDIVRNTPFTYLILTKRVENIESRLPPDWGRGWENVWLGVSVESNEYMHRARELSAIPAQTRFISYEPSLGPINWNATANYYLFDGIHWIISGGESDNIKPRLADPDWFRAARDYCVANNIAFFHKQNGGSKKINGAWGGRELDGMIWNQFPASPKRRGAWLAQVET